MISRTQQTEIQSVTISSNIWHIDCPSEGMKQISMKYILCAALSLVLVGCGGGSPLTLTQDNLNKVQDGMSQAQVREIMGAPSESKDEPIPIVGGTKTTYTYHNDNNTSTVTIVFKNDQEQSKDGHFGQ